MITQDRAYCNPMSVWGVRKYDPFNIENMKRNEVRIDKDKNYWPDVQKSRYLSPNPCTYLT